MEVRRYSVGTVWRMTTGFILLFGRAPKFRQFNLFNVCIFRSELNAEPLFKNSPNKVPSLSQRTPAMALAAEVCALNLFSLVLPPVPI
jgi:hypothetical protein